MRRVVAAALLEDPACLALQPALHRIADLFGACRLRQPDVQREPRHAGQRVLGGMQHGAGGTRVHHDDHRLAEKRDARAVAPVDAGLLQALLSLLLLAQLAQDPASLFAQRVLDLAEADPLGRADGKALLADDEADAAPAHTLERITDDMLVEADLARRLRMAKERG